MAITAFQTNTETGLAAAAADLLAAGATFDDAAANQENAQLLVWVWMLVKAIRTRQNGTPASGTGTAKDRVFELVGGHSAAAMLPLMTMIEDVYAEFLALFNDVDAAGDDPWGTNILTNGTGPENGPVHGQPA